MKKLLAIVSIIALALSSCANHNSSDSDSAENDMLSNDLRYYRLHGQVQKVVYSDTGLVIEFDKDGKLVSFNGYNPFCETKEDNDSTSNVYAPSSFIRDEEGRISIIKTATTVNNYTWENGLVVMDEGEGENMKWTCSYEHDANGNAIYEYDVYTDNLGKELSRGTTSYTILNTDDHGNWIERSAKYTPDHVTADDRESGPFHQKREIIYY